METLESKRIILGTSSKDWYYSLKEHDTIVVERTLSGMCTVRGICRENVGIGDMFLIGTPPKLTEYTIESISKEDSKGQFNNPDDAINALFTAECSFSRQINL